MDQSNINRRNFLTLATLALADVTIGGPISCTTAPPSPEVAAKASTKGRVVMALRPPPNAVTSKIRIFEWDDYSFTDHDVPIGLVHAIVQDDHDPATLYLFEIFGSCLKYDLRTKKSVKIDHHGKRELFGGHGAMAGSGDFIACTELDLDRGSFVTLRSAKDLSKVAVAPKECGNSHHVIALPKSPLLASGVMRGYDGKKEVGAISFYDSEKRQLVNRIDVDFPVLHLMPLSSTEVIGLSQLTKYTRDPKTALSSDRDTAENISTFTRTQTFVPGPVYYASVDGNTKTLWSEKDKAILLDGFGLAKLGPRKFLSGHHSSGKVVLWDDFQLKQIVSVPRVKNLLASRDGKELLALSDEKLMIYSLADFSLIKSFADGPTISCFASYG